MIMNSGPPADGWWLIYTRHFFPFFPFLYRCWPSFFIDIFDRGKTKRSRRRVKVCALVCNQFSIWSYYSRRLLNRGNRERLLATFNTGSWNHGCSSISIMSDCQQILISFKGKCLFLIYRSAAFQNDLSWAADRNYVTRWKNAIFLSKIHYQICRELEKPSQPFSERVCHSHARMRTKERQFFALETFRNVVAAWRGATRPGWFRIINLGDIC